MDESSSTYPLAELRDQLAIHALEIGAAFGSPLNYSIRSVKKVEKILGQLEHDYSRRDDKSGLTGNSLQFGAYLIKVIEANFDSGRWERNHPELGEDAFPYFWKDKIIFPCAWCEKRLIDGSGDNVWTKFRVLVLDEDKKSRGLW